MKTEHWIVGIAVLWALDRYMRSHQGISAIDKTVNTELAHFTAMNGTNFTASRWDTASGQPSYMFGEIDAPGGAGISSPDYTYSGAFGHV